MGGVEKCSYGRGGKTFLAPQWTDLGKLQVQVGRADSFGFLRSQVDAGQEVLLNLVRFNPLKPPEDPGTAGKPAQVQGSVCSGRTRHRSNNSMIVVEFHENQIPRFAGIATGKDRTFSRIDPDRSFGY